MKLSMLFMRCFPKSENVTLMLMIIMMSALDNVGTKYLTGILISHIPMID